MLQGGSFALKFVPPKYIDKQNPRWKRLRFAVWIFIYLMACNLGGVRSAVCVA